MAEHRSPGRTLTVVIRDDAPMVFAGDTPRYRSVRVQLTEEQREALTLRYVGRCGTTEYHEEVSRCFIEPEETAHDPAD